MYIQCVWVWVCGAADPRDDPRDDGETALTPGCLFESLRVYSRRGVDARMRGRKNNA